jgi:hypothetical protein
MKWIFKRDDIIWSKNNGQKYKVDGIKNTDPILICVKPIVNDVEIPEIYEYSIHQFIPTEPKFIAGVISSKGNEFEIITELDFKLNKNDFVILGTDGYEIISEPRSERQALNGVSIIQTRFQAIPL